MVSEAVSAVDECPVLREKVVDADLVIIATPTWLGQQSSISKRILERMDALLSETKDDGQPIAYDKVAGVVVTGNEDGAHHCMAEISGALIDIGDTLAGQGWPYWNKGPGPGEEEYLNSDDTEWSRPRSPLREEFARGSSCPQSQSDVRVTCPPLKSRASRAWTTPGRIVRSLTAFLSATSVRYQGENHER